MNINISYFPLNSEVIQFSATELSRLLQRAVPDSIITINNYNTACNLNISLQADNVEALDDACSIQIQGGSGSITGSNERSVLLGVYSYMRALGCRFLAPGASGEVFPAISSIEGLYCCQEHHASLRHRGVCIEGANSLENILDFVDWLPKLGYNSFFLQFRQPYTFMARWYHHELNPLLPPEAFTAETADHFTSAIIRAMKQRGLMLHQAGHGWTGPVIGCDSNDWKTSCHQLTPQESAKVALVNGSRQLFHGIPMNTNLCYSNPDVIRDFTAEVVSYIQNHPDIDYLHVWLADEYNNVCECEECQKTTLSDQYIHLLNQIDAELTRLGLPTRIVFLLYQELLWPPVHAHLLHPDRFILMFAPISRTFEHSYDPKGTGSVPPYQRNQISLPVDLDENLAYLHAWQQIFSGDSFVYDYPLGRAHYGDLGYVHIAQIISEDIKKIRSMGLNGYISCQELRAGLPNALPNYVMGYTLFDNQASFEALCREYYQAAYGDDWEWVLNHLTTVSALCSCDYFNGKGSRTDASMAARMEALLSLMHECSEFLSLRRQKGKKENLFWKQLDYHCDYGLQLGEALLALARGDRAAAQTLWNSFQEMICRHEIEFQSCLDVYRITEVSSKYTGFHLNQSLLHTL